MPAKARSYASLLSCTIHARVARRTICVSVADLRNGRMGRPILDPKTNWTIYSCDSKLMSIFGHKVEDIGGQKFEVFKETRWIKNMVFFFF